MRLLLIIFIYFSNLNWILISAVTYCSEADNLYEKCISSTDIVDSFPKRNEKNNFQKVYILTMHQRSTVQKNENDEIKKYSKEKRFEQ